MNILEITCDLALLVFDETKVASAFQLIFPKILAFRLQCTNLSIAKHLLN